MSDTDDTLREQIERLLGTATLKNDKNYTNDIMHLISQDRVERDIDSRISELGALDLALDTTEILTSTTYSLKRGYLKARLAELKKLRKDGDEG